MKNERTEEGRFTLQGKGLGTVTESMLQKRAEEIALINGRGSDQVIESDVAQARRELLGEERLNPQTPESETLSESARWDPNAESTGRMTPAVPAADEQTFAEKLVEEGVADAEHDQQVRATRESLKREKRS
jgi:hypothetical protein